MTLAAGVHASEFYCFCYFNNAPRMCNQSYCLTEKHFDTFRKDVILHCHLSQILQDSLYFDECVMHLTRYFCGTLKYALVNLNLNNLNNDLPPVVVSGGNLFQVPKGPCLMFTTTVCNYDPNILKHNNKVELFTDSTQVYDQGI